MPKRILENEMIDIVKIRRLAKLAKAANAIVAATNAADIESGGKTFQKIHDMANDLTISTQMDLGRALGVISGNEVRVNDDSDFDHDVAHQLWSGDASDELIDECVDQASQKRPALLGYQIADRTGSNIQGEEGDPSGEASYRILSLAEAHEIMRDPDNRHLLLQPIYEGDIENPELPE